MRIVAAYIAMSLDGYVADDHGSVAWLGGDGSDSENFGSYPAFIQTVDTVILGYTTYHQIVTELAPNDWPYKGKTTYVLTHRALESTDEIIFTSQEITSLVSTLQAQEGQTIWLCGGANVIAQFHEKGLIDQYTISVIPTLLGSGVRLFPILNGETKLALISTTTYNGIVDLVYKKR